MKAMVSSAIRSVIVVWSNLSAGVSIALPARCSAAWYRSDRTDRKNHAGTRNPSDGAPAYRRGAIAEDAGPETDLLEDFRQGDLVGGALRSLGRDCKHPAVASSDPVGTSERESPCPCASDSGRQTSAARERRADRGACVSNWFSLTPRLGARASMFSVRISLFHVRTTDRHTPGRRTGSAGHWGLSLHFLQAGEIGGLLLRGARLRLRVQVSGSAR